MQPLTLECVSTNDYNSAGDRVVTSLHSSAALSDDPASHPRSEAVSVSGIWVSTDTVKNCAKVKGGLKALWLAARWKMYAGGRHAISKDECPDWKKLVHWGFARDGQTHIHLNTLDLGGELTLFEARFLDCDPVLIAAWMIQTFFLRIAKLGGRAIETRKRHLRLVSNLDCGGMCLDLLAAAFNRTKSWASEMRRRLERAGLCTFERRFSWVSKEEGDVARIIGEGDRYIEVKKAGRYLRERVSLCTTISEPQFKSPWRPKAKPDGNDLQTYLKRKGRVCA